MRIPNGSILKRPAIKLFQIEYFEYKLDKNVDENTNENVIESLVRPKRNAAVAGELCRRFAND